MALYSTTSASTALTASSTKTFVLLNPVDHAVKIKKIRVTSDESALKPGAKLEVVRVTSLGSPAGTTGTQVKVSPNSDSGSATTTSLTALTTEPTTYEIVDIIPIPLPGGILYDYPLGEEPIAASGGSRIGVRIVNPASGSTGNVAVSVTFEE